MTSTGAARTGYEGLTTAEVPKVPPRYRTCAQLAVLPSPKGGWTRSTALKALGAIRVSEITKRDCLLDLADWSDQALDSARGNRGTR